MSDKQSEVDRIYELLTDVFLGCSADPYVGSEASDGMESVEELRRILLPKGDGSCCAPDCEATAEFEIYGDEAGDQTLACERHVGMILGSPVDGPENLSWTVCPLPEEQS